MRDVYLDVSLEVSRAALEDVPNSGQVLLDKLRPKVDEMVAHVPGAYVRTDRVPELIIERGTYKLAIAGVNEDMILVASRWCVTVPESAVL